MSAYRTTVLVTGGSGFVGRAVLSRLVRDGYRPRATVRHRAADMPQGVESVVGPNLEEDFNWAPALSGCDVVVHAAARVHVMRDTAFDPDTQFRRVNVDGTLRLAHQAATAGVRRFLFLSSAKVNGEETAPGEPFTPDAVPAPQDAYGRSKRDAETGLRALATSSGMEVVVLRPVLVYGPGVKANFRSMMRWLAGGVPLPLGAIRNRRSLVALENLVDLIVTCVVHPSAANETFLVSDDDDLSTTELLRRTAHALGRRARLVPVPMSMLQLGAVLTGNREVAQRLLGCLQVDISKTRQLLHWAPPVSVEDGLQSAARWFLQHERGRT